MNHKIIRGTLLAACILAACAAMLPAQEGIAAPGAKVRRLASGFSFTEGPTCDAAGNVYFTDQPRDAILRWTTDGRLETFLKPAGRSNGMCFTSDGTLLACADAHNELWAIAPDGTRKVLAGPVDGLALNGPNDVYAHPSGSIYFTDPYYQRDWFPHKKAPRKERALWHLAPGAAAPVALVTDFVQPNGLTGSPDGTFLYVSDIDAKKTWRFPVLGDGTLGERTLFCAQGSDGMTVDNQGNVYLTGNGVTVYDPRGTKIDQIKVREGWTANVCFGGADHSTLFITASTGLWALDTRVKAAFIPGK